MPTLRALGDWLDNSVWTVALSNAKVPLTGNQSLVSMDDITTTNYSHQVTAWALRQLKHQCFNEAIGSKDGENNKKIFLVWSTETEKRSL